MIHAIRFILMLTVLAAGFFWLEPRGEDESKIDVAFVDRAEQAGCKNVHTMVKLSDVFDNIMPWLSSVGAAAAAADYDNDGFADLYVTNSGRGDQNRLFHNRGDGTFEDVTSRAGVGCGNPQGASMHAIWGDVDNDGFLDLYVVKWAEPNQLFRNNHDGTFTDISREAGVDNWGYANGATYLDYDRDGRLDILVGNYFAETVVDPKTGQRVRNDLWNPASTRVMHETFTHARNGGHNVLYHNVSKDGKIRFENVAESVGLKFGGWTLSVGAGDLNNDGWPDLYLANDFGPDEFYVNTGATESPPRFRLVVDPKGHPGVGNDWWKGMNVDIGDVNNDGYLDIYVTNILERRYKTDEGNMLWLNCYDPDCPGGRGFMNIAHDSGTQDGGWGWGGKFADFNNDGLLDIFTVNGFVTGDLNHNYWYAIQEMVTQTKNQTADAHDWPVMGKRDLSGHELSRLFMQRKGNDPRRQEGSETTGNRQRATEETSKRRNVETSKQEEVRSSKFEVQKEASTQRGNEESEPGAQATGSLSPYQGGIKGGSIDNRQSPIDNSSNLKSQISDSIGNRKSAIGNLHTGEPRFVEMAVPAGITDTYNGRGIAVADFNHDGYLDMYIANQGAPANYYVNVTNSKLSADESANRGFLWLKLIGRPDLPLTVGDRTFASTSDAVGSRVTVYTARGKQIREVQGGQGFESQSEYAVHFGIPDIRAVDRITIQWPSGRIQEFAGERAHEFLGRFVRLREGDTEAASW